MVGVESLPNPFGGFSPFPNSIMIPFMAAQSSVLAYNFGIDYEKGKRMVKSMDNEDFNLYMKNDEIVDTPYGKMTYTNYLKRKNAEENITMMREMVPSFVSLQTDIIESSVDIEKLKAQRTPSAMVEILNALGSGASQTVKDWYNTILDDPTKSENFAQLAAVNPLLAMIIFWGEAQNPQPDTKDNIQLTFSGYATQYDSVNKAYFAVNVENLKTNYFSNTVNGCDAGIAWYNQEAQKIQTTGGTCYENAKSYSSVQCEVDTYVLLQNYSQAIAAITNYKVANF